MIDCAEFDNSSDSAIPEFREFIPSSRTSTSPLSLSPRYLITRVNRVKTIGKPLQTQFLLVPILLFFSHSFFFQNFAWSSFKPVIRPSLDVSLLEEFHFNFCSTIVPTLSGGVH